MHISDDGTVTIHGVTLTPRSGMDVVLQSDINDSCSHKDLGAPAETIEFPVITDGDKQITVIALYFGAILRAVKILDTSIRAGTTWDENIETGRKESNEAWFRSHSNAGFGAYPWGSIESLCTEAAGLAMIVITYDD